MKTSKSNFKFFIKEVQYWVDYFGLKDWDIDFHHSILDGSLAVTSGNWQQKHASITLNTYWDEDYHNPEQFKRVAFHEACELLLMEVRILACSRYLADSDINNAVHTVISRLTNTVYKEKR
jgi:hypothetical protein